MKREFFFPVILTAAPIFFLSAVIFQPFFEPKLMFMDTMTAIEEVGSCCSTYYGMVSDLGIMLWAGTAAILMFTAFVLFHKKENQNLAIYALFGGLLTGWLTLDDAFRLHENFFPSIGIPQNLILGLDMLALGAFLLIYFKQMRENYFGLLAISLVGFGISMGTDVVLHSVENYVIYIEDSAKFIGIYCWLLFHAFTSRKHIAENI